MFFTRTHHFLVWIQVVGIESRGRHPQKWKLEPIPCFLQVRSYFFCLTPPYVGQKPIPTSYGSNMISSCFCQNRHRFDPKTSHLACRDSAKFGVAMVSFACNGLKGKTSTGNHDFFHSPWKNIKHHLWRFHEVSVNCPIVPSRSGIPRIVPAIVLSASEGKLPECTVSYTYIHLPCSRSPKIHLK